jgi:hypothetical protein
MKAINVKLPDGVYDEMMSYAEAKGKSLTAFSRGVIKHAFFDSMQSDRADLDRFTRMLAEPSKYELTKREEVELETKVAMLKILNDRYSEFWADLASELYGEDSDNA